MICAIFAFGYIRKKPVIRYQKQITTNHKQRTKQNGNMKRMVLAMVVACLATINLSAQKFALVDMEYILKNIPAYERANEQLKQI